jgi:hypothetical protein
MQKALVMTRSFFNLQNSGTSILIFNISLVIASYKVNPLFAVEELVNYQMIQKASQEEITSSGP